MSVELKELATRQKQEVQAPERPPAQSMLQAVMRMAEKPDLDPARLREFLTIGRELEADQARKQYNQAWLRLMPKMPVITKEGQIEYKPGTRPTQFARWEDIHHACMPLLYEEGFAVSFDSETVENKLTVITIITHESGHEERRRFTVAAQDTGGSKSPAQASASSLSLAQRQGFMKAFNILTKNKTEVGEVVRISDEDKDRIEAIIDQCDQREAGAKQRFSKWIKVQMNADSPAQLFTFQLGAVMEALSALQKRVGLAK